MLLDERVARIEGRMTEQSKTLDFFRDAMNRIDGRFAQMDARFAQVDVRFDHLEDKMSRQFVWLVGIQVTTLLAMIGGLLGVIGVLAGRN
ncbi:MAG TPA: hypothetical protein VG871_14875 [Vicinamibacterales bacterium]|nr:hypothetical protein [Vicinamibacterales bacterium]